MVHLNCRPVAHLILEPCFGPEQKFKKENLLTSSDKQANTFELLSEPNNILGHVVNEDVLKGGSLELLNPAMGQPG